MATGSGRPVQLAGDLDVNRAEKGPEDTKNPVRFYFNVIFVHYSSASWAKPAKSKCCLSPVYGRLLSNPNG